MWKWIGWFFSENKCRFLDWGQQRQYYLSEWSGYGNFYCFSRSSSYIWWRWIVHRYAAVRGNYNELLPNYSKKRDCLYAGSSNGFVCRTAGNKSIAVHISVCYPNGLSAFSPLCRALYTVHHSTYCATEQDFKANGGTGFFWSMYCCAGRWIGVLGTKSKFVVGLALYCAEWSSNCKPAAQDRYGKGTSIRATAGRIFLGSLPRTENTADYFERSLVGDAERDQRLWKPHRVHGAFPCSCWQDGKSGKRIVVCF